MQREPLFLKNSEWYVTPDDGDFFDDGRGYHLSPDAPQEAVDSYNEFYNPVFIGDDGIPVEDGLSVTS